MKDEFKGKKTSEFGGLNSKMYSIIKADDEEVTKAKRSEYKNKTLLMFCSMKKL